MLVRIRIRQPWGEGAAVSAESKPIGRRRLVNDYFPGTSMSRCAAASSTDARRYRSGKYCPFAHCSRRLS